MHSVVAEYPGNDSAEPENGVILQKRYLLEQPLSQCCALPAPLQGSLNMSPLKGEMSQRDRGVTSLKLRNLRKAGQT